MCWADFVGATREQNGNGGYIAFVHYMPCPITRNVPEPHMTSKPVLGAYDICVQGQTGLPARRNITSMEH